MTTTLRAALRADAARALRFSLLGVAAFVVVEPIISIVLARGPVRVPTALRFFALDLTLAGVLLALLFPLAALAFAGARLLVAAAASPARARDWPGVFGRAPDGADPAAVGPMPWIWAALAAASVYAGASYSLTYRFIKRYKEAKLIAASLAGAQLALILACAAGALLCGVLLRRAARALAPHLGAWNPLGRAWPAAALLGVGAVVAYFVVVKRLPQLRQVAPWRELVAFAVVACGGATAMRLLGERPLLPASLTRDPRRRRVLRLGLPVAWLLLAAVTLGWLGADPETKYLATSASPPMARLVGVVRTANDFDRDGYGSLLGENDCAPFDRRIHPTARDLPDNGVDENCNGRDFSTKTPPSFKAGEKLPVPEEYRRDWNILLITVDTVRYDHTTMGGYDKRRKRDTTPSLARLAARSINFEFAQTAAPGTMAAIPAIIVSRFFHSGIHLGPERRPMPPKILDDNTTIAEVLKRAGYRTGAILSHEYFNDWGLDQGFDSYDNELGKKSDPYGIKSPDVTDKAQAWIARQGNSRWFLWAHYIDPHGRYVAHPGEVSYGSAEEDLYDGELRFTDKHIGRLLEFIARTPAADRTIVIITSDHGDGFNEHGFINHGQKLYWELMHVPLIVYIPDAEPHSVAGPVSNLDIFPTVADLAGVDISDLDIEGVSLVPQLFYGRDAGDRVVFGETNYPEPLRSATAADYKLIYNLKSNVYELYDLRADPAEKKNVWQKDQAGSQKMKALLDEWLDSVFFKREAGTQAHEVRKQVLLDARPAPQHPAEGTVAGAVRVLGWDASKQSVKPGDALTVVVYFECVAEVETNYRLELSLTALPATPPPPGTPAPPPLPGTVLRQERVPLDGTFPTSRWKQGEFIKETYTFKIPPTWNQPGPVQLGFRLLDPQRKPAAAEGRTVTADGTQLVLGELPSAQ